MFSSDLGSGETSDPYSSRLSVFHGPGLPSSSDSAYASIDTDRRPGNDCPDTQHIIERHEDDAEGTQTREQVARIVSTDDVSIDSETIDRTPPIPDNDNITER
jgi:hypothetical protein